MLASRLALVSGGGSGIGRAVCQVLAREGATVLAADINLSSAEHTVSLLSGGGHRSLQVDVSDSESVAAMFSEMLAIEPSAATINTTAAAATTADATTAAAPPIAAAPITAAATAPIAAASIAPTAAAASSAPIAAAADTPDILVNCAGVTGDALLCDISDTVFQRVLATNLYGTLLLTRTVVNRLRRQRRRGAIVNIASIVAKTGNIGQTAYAASKAGVEGLTRCVALELAEHGIRCNAVLPGFIDTPMVAAVPEKVRRKLLPRIPMARVGRPDEVAELVAFLASDRASYITGASIPVAGGFGI